MTAYETGSLWCVKDQFIGSLLWVRAEMPNEIRTQEWTNFRIKFERGKCWLLLCMKKNVENDLFGCFLAPNGTLVWMPKIVIPVYFELVKVEK